jgi:type VI secretion system secreted protein Hcp
MAIYIKYGDIKGGVTTEGFADQVELGSFQFGVGRGIASPTGSGADREASVASLSEITVTKMFDKSSNKFLMESLMGEGRDCEITFTRTAQGQESAYLKYTLTDALISGYSLSSGGDRPSESISINFVKVVVDVTLADADNKDGTPDKVGWDLGLSKKV